MRQPAIIFLSALTILFSSCEKVGTKKLYKLDEGFKSYFKANDGSFWKYKLATDTSVVETVISSGFESGDLYWEDLVQEFFTYNLTSDIDSPMIVRTVATADFAARWALLRRDTGFKQIAELFYTSAQLSGVGGNNDTVNYLPSMNVGDVVYNNVVELISARKRHVKKLYFASNIGIIRKDLTDGRIFLLSEYKLK